MRGRIPAIVRHEWSYRKLKRCVGHGGMAGDRPMIEILVPLVKGLMVDDQALKEGWHLYLSDVVAPASWSAWWFRDHWKYAHILPGPPGFLLLRYLGYGGQSHAGQDRESIATIARSLSGAMAAGIRVKVLPAWFGRTYYTAFFTVSFAGGGA